jgi:uncharacterized protein (TIGR02099 family)
MSPLALLQRLWRPLWALVAFALIAAAVLLTVLRLSLPLLSEYRGTLEARMSAYLDAEVAVGAMDVEWHGLGPRLRLADLRVSGLGADGEPLVFREAFVRLALAPGAGVPLRIAEIALSGLALEVRIDAAGRIHALGRTLDPRAAGGAPPGEAGVARANLTTEPVPEIAEAVRRLAGLDALALTDLRVGVTGPGGQRVVLPEMDLRLFRQGGAQRLALRAGLPEVLGERLRVAVEARGLQGPPDAWSVRGYVAGDDLSPAGWAGFWPGLATELLAGQGDVEAWLRWRAGTLQRLLVDLDARGLSLRARAAGPAGQGVRLDRAAGRVLWARRGGGWVLHAGDVALERGGRAWPETGFSLARRAPEAAGPGWALDSGFARLEDLAALGLALPLPESMHRRIAQWDPQGDLESLQLSGDGRESFRLAAGFRDLGWAARGDVPGVSGLDGSLHAEPGGGELTLATTAAELRLPRLFRGPLPVAHADGTIEVERDGARIELRSRGLEVANADLRAEGRMHVRIRPDAPVWLDLKADFAEGDVGATSRYLPAGIMKDDIVAWLDRALVEGRVLDGTMLLRGPADAFPFRGREGTFDVDFRVAGARLAFAPEWPALREMRGRVHFTGPGLTITAREGRMLDARVQRLGARFADFRRPLLEIEAGLRGPMEDVIRTLTETPLRGGVGQAFLGASGSGPVGLELDLAVPIDDVDATRVDGRFRLDGVTLEQPRYQLSFTGLEGAGTFTHRGLSIDGLRGRLRGQPVTIDAVTRAEPARRIDFSIAGRLGIDALLPQAGPALADRIRGRSAWEVDIAVPIDRAGDAIRLSGRSSLAGTSIDAPPPLGKAASSQRPLYFDVPIDPAGDRHVARLALGGDTRAVLAVDTGGRAPALERIGLRFGGDEPVFPETPGLHLAGRLESLDLAPWLAALTAGDGDGASGGGEGAGLPPLAAAKLRLARVHHGQHVATGVEVDAVRRDGRMAVRLRSNELHGEVTVPIGGGPGQPVRARFDWIDLALLLPDEPGTPSAAARATATEGGGKAGAELRPDDVPALDVRIERVELQRGTLHDVALVTRPAAGRLTIHRLQFDNPGLSLEGQGSWVRDNGRARTELRLEFRGDDLGRGVAELGYPGLLKRGRGWIRATAEWPDAPWSPGVEGLTGFARGELEEGVIRQVDVGPARILGLLSLDVQGIVQEGFPYDRIEGRVDFADGNAYTRNLRLEGPPGDIRIQGRTGLVDGDYDQTIRFRPQLSRSLPVLGALSGGPATGLAVAVVQGLLRTLGADMEKASEVTFRLTGPWGDPKVERVSSRTEDEASSREPDGPSGTGIR